MQIVRLAVQASRVVLTTDSQLRRAAARCRTWLVRGLLAAVAVVLGLGVLVNHQASLVVGSPPVDQVDAPDTGEADHDSPIPEAPTIVAGGQLAGGFSMAPNQVALTFDDGPHPVWTPRVLDELDRLDVRATFFVIGEQVSRYPDLVREIVRRGHEIGNHTHFHYRMGQLSEAEVERQLDLARLALVEATGLTTDLYRPPYSGAIHNLDPLEVQAAGWAIDHGYVLVATDLAPRDYDEDVTVDELLATSMPAIGAGAVITLHDGGGDDRSRTVDMLEPMVRSLRERGYTFAVVGDVIEQATGTDPIRVAPSAERFKATTLHWVLRIAGVVETVAVVAAIGFAALFVSRFLILGAVAFVQWRRHRRGAESEPEHRPITPAVTVIVPAYNEAVGIEATVRSIDATDWPELEILVVDDGSTDDTGAIAERLGLERVTVLRKANGGKASALNYGIVRASHDILVMVDGDTILEPDTIPRLVQPFSDADVGAVAGNPKIGNVGRPLARLQVSEYLLSSSLERRILAPAQMITTIPGAVGAWRRSAVQEVGGVSSSTLAEDTDLTVAVARGGWRIAYEPQARAWTEAPSTVRSLFAQRVRWTFGTLQVISKQRAAVTDRGRGSQLGRAALPYLFVTGYVFAALAPMIDVVLLVNLLLGNWELAIASWLAVAAVGAVAGVTAAHLDGDALGPALLVPVQQILFRPLLHTVVVVSLKRAVLGERQIWGAQERVGGLVIGGGAET